MLSSNSYRTNSNDNTLELKFLRLFLAVSKEFQNVNVPQDIQDKLLERFRNELGIINGYFVELEPNQNHLIYFFEGIKQGTTNFEPIPIKYYRISSERNDSLYQKLSQSETKFESILKAPKLYQHLPIQPIGSNKHKLISDDYLNCYIPNKIKDESDYYVVLFDEIVFFQFAYCYKTNKSLYDYYKDYSERKLLLIYLLKFALSIEQKLGHDTLHKVLGLESKKSDWNKYEEINTNGVRADIYGIVKKNYPITEWNENINTLIKNVVDNLLQEFDCKNIYCSIPENSREKQILKHIARFDIEASFEVTDNNGKLIFHDVFVFPLYTETQPIYFTKYIDPDFAGEVGIYSPVLLVLYIKTLYKLTNHDKFDENLSSIEGFQLTKEISKLFAEKLIKEDYFKNVIQKESQPAAIRAAISQVMARNTSHNIGAHVMNKLIGNLREITLIQNPEKKGNYKSDQTLAQLHSDVVKKVESNSALKEFQSEAIKNEILLEQIAIFNNYVKCRMDYLADISFGTPLMQTNKFAYSDLFKELDKVRLLLDHISGLSENFKYEIKFKYNGDKPMNNENDLPIAIPNDILGMQAFYNILENVIRNTAKHAKQKSPITTFTVNFIDKLENLNLEQQNVLNDYIVVEVYDNIIVEGSGRALTSEEKEEYKRVMGSAPENFDSEIDSLIFSQNSRINADILKDNQLRSGALGVIEMDASAAYLRKRNVSFINHDNYTVRYDDSWSANSVKAQNNDCERGMDCRNFLKAFKKEIPESVNNNQGFALGYRFFLLRPEVVLIVTNIKPDTEESPDKVKELKKQGVWIVKPNIFEKHLTEGKVYNHEFVIIHKEKTEAQDNSKTEIDLTTYKTSLSLRILEVQEGELITLFGNINDESKKDWLSTFEDFCWEKWNKDYLKLDLPNGISYPKKGGKLSSNLDHNEEGEYQKAFDSNLYFYLDSLSSSAQNKLPGFKKDLVEYLATLSDSTIKFKVGESIYSRLLIIDERIQKNSEGVYLEISLATLYSMTGVILPTINLSSSILDKDAIVSEIESYIPELNKQDVKDASKEKLLNPYTDFIIIHYSILERVFNSDKDEIALLLKKWGKKANVVMTSGRGEPENLPIEVRYINLSSVVHSLIESRSKYFANYVFHLSRKSSKIKIS